MKRQIELSFLIILIIFIAVVPIVLLLVNKADTDPKWDYYIEPGIYTAQEEIHQGNINYSLETYMWRDFMPISPPNGKPLIVVARVHAHNVEEFPLTTQIERLWLIDGTKINSTLATNEYRVDGSTLEMVFRDGPKWGPGISIDVVIRLRIFFQIYYLKVVNQPIHQTW